MGHARGRSKGPATVAHDHSAVSRQKGKFHDIERPGQEAEIDELFVDLYGHMQRLDILTRKGDIITYDGTNYVRLARGGDGQVLTARSTATAGLVWEDRATGDGSTGGGSRKYWFGGLCYGAL